MNKNQVAASLATLAVTLVLILGFRTMGGPGKQRLVRTDQWTIQTLAQLAQQINLKWQNGGRKLPANLEAFPGNAKKSPVTGKAFVYRLKSASEYELCATFETDNRDSPEVNTADPWLHPKGDYCFSLDAGETVTVPWVPSY